MGTYIRLVDYGSQKEKENAFLEAVENKNISKIKFNPSSSDFPKITGSPIAYWVSENTLNAYGAPSLSASVLCKSGIMTGSDTYIKLWTEVNIKKIKFDCKSYDDMSDFKWFPLNSGGEFRKWYGNNSKIVNLWNNGLEIKSNVKNYRLRDPELYFKPGVTWGRITSSQIAFRDVVAGSLFGDAGPIGFINDGKKYVLGFLCSKVVKYLLQITNPTLNFQVHDIMDLPLVINDEHYALIESYVSDCVELSRQDWDSFETSWDFKKHPLV